MSCQHGPKKRLHYWENKEIIDLETNKVSYFRPHCMAIMGYLSFVALCEESPKTST
jgi:hypothetical protein